MSGFKGAILAAGRGERLRASGGAFLPKPLVELGGSPMLARQATALLEAGAGEVLAIINSETAALLKPEKFPPKLSLMVRDTPNSMESLFALGERLSAGHFLLATVDAVMPESELRAFVEAAFVRLSASNTGSDAGVLAVVRWRGDRNPLFTSVTSAGLITELGARSAEMVTAGFYVLPALIFRLVDKARRQRLGAMREFLALLLNEGFCLQAIEVKNAIDVDEAPDLDAARRLAENNR